MFRKLYSNNSKNEPRGCPTNIFPIESNIPPSRWFLSSLDMNKLMHILNGNRSLGYRLSSWNCRKGLLLPDKSASPKLTDIKSLLHKHDLHLLGIVESDLHGVNSRVKRSNPVSTKDILDNLHVDGYSIKLPSSWYSHGQARIILYVKEGVKIKMRKLNNQDSDLPTLSCEVGLGKERRTITNFFYREWKSGVTGLEDQASQLERQARQINHWKSLYSKTRDVLILGDANLCCFKWNAATYQHKPLAEELQDFLLQTSSFQVIKDYTRSEICNNGLTRSCIDHCYTDAPEKLSKILVEPAGDSDHLAVVVTKLCKVPVTKPQTVKKRSYTNFNAANFLTDIYNSDINRKVKAENDIEEAAKAFKDIFSEVLDFHAPIKIFQMRKNYSPEISAPYSRKKHSPTGSNCHR